MVILTSNDDILFSKYKHGLRIIQDGKNQLLLGNEKNNILMRTQRAYTLYMITGILHTDENIKISQVKGKQDVLFCISQHLRLLFQINDFEYSDLL